MKNVYKCEYCDFTAENYQEIYDHEQICEAKQMLHDMEIHLTFETVQAMIKSILFTFWGAKVAHEMAMKAKAEAGEAEQ